MKDMTSGNLNMIYRSIRLTIGFSLILSVTLQAGALGNLLLLPLIGIYPSITGILGWDPLYYYFFGKKSRRPTKTTKHSAKIKYGTTSNT